MQKRPAVVAYTFKPFRELSNFYPCRIVIGGKAFRSVEHYYHSRKPRSVKLRAYIVSAKTAKEAKERSLELKGKDIVPGWERKKVKVMRAALFAKFTQHKELRRKLIATGDVPIHEHNPSDRFWSTPGKDMFGRLVVELRAALRSDNPRSFLKD